MKQPFKTLVTTAASAALMLASSASFAAGHQCSNDVWNKVMKRGKMVVGVKADYKPWGYRDTSGNIVGMEADMAKIAADAMGVELELVAVQSSNRMQFLENGKIDLMIATMSDRPDRRKIVGITQPNYYTSGTNVMSPKAVGISKWEDLRGKPVCGKQGAFYNKIVTDRYGAKVIAFTGNAEAKQALRDKKCIAWVYDDSSIMSDLSSGNWDAFEMPLASEDDVSALLDKLDIPETKMTFARTEPHYIPPEPFRWIGAQITMYALDTLDEKGGWRKPWIWLVQKMGFPITL